MVNCNLFNEDTNETRLVPVVDIEGEGFMGGELCLYTVVGFGEMAVIKRVWQLLSLVGSCHQAPFERGK